MWTLARTDHPDADTEQTASALLRCVARDPDAATVGRRFSSAAVELALASYPGFTSTAPPGDGQVYGVFTAAYVPADKLTHVAVHADGTRVELTHTDFLRHGEGAEAYREALSAPEGWRTSSPKQCTTRRRKRQALRKRGAL